MNHLCAKQRQADGRWDYTCNGHPYGYCRQYTPIPEDGSMGIPAEIAKQENEKMEPFLEKFHDIGHATEAEARECYKQYILDTKLRLVPVEPVNASQQNRCEVCKRFTACHVTIGPYRMFTLCPDHQNRETLAGLLKIGESWES